MESGLPSTAHVPAINHRGGPLSGPMKKACLISLLMVLCSLSGCTDMEAFTDPDPTEDEEWDYGL